MAEWREEGMGRNEGKGREYEGINQEGNGMEGKGIRRNESGMNEWSSPLRQLLFHKDDCNRNCNQKSTSKTSWWKNSCTSWNMVKYPIIDRVSITCPGVFLFGFLNQKQEGRHERKSEFRICQPPSEGERKILFLPKNPGEVDSRWMSPRFYLVGGWFTSPFEKLCERQIGSWNPKVRSENEKILDILVN